MTILCVDNASTDGTADVIRAYAPRGVRYLSCAYNGSYAARNAGIARAGGDILAFTDADCRPTPTWLHAGVDRLERGDLDRVAGAVHIPAPSSAGLWARVDGSFYLDQERAVARGWAATANLFVRRTVVDRVGLFDAHLISWGDIAFGRRCTAAGLSLGYAAEALVVHPPRTRLHHLIRRSWRGGRGHAQAARAGLPAPPGARHALFPRPLDPALVAARLTPPILSGWERMALPLMRYGAVEVVHMAAIVWERSAWAIAHRTTRGRGHATPGRPMMAHLSADGDDE